MIYSFQRIAKAAFRKFIDTNKSCRAILKPIAQLIRRSDETARYLELCFSLNSPLKKTFAG